MPRGGPRPNSGRKPGSTNRVTVAAREAARETGLLPHEWLLKVSRGEPIEQKRWKDVLDGEGNVVDREVVTEVVYADFGTRMDAAKAAAPFYAPRLATQTVSVQGGNEAVAEALKIIAGKLPV